MGGGWVADIAVIADIARDRKGKSLPLQDRSRVIPGIGL
jgi:hypothetical protein